MSQGTVSSFSKAFGLFVIQAICKPVQSQLLFKKNVNQSVHLEIF